MEWRFHAPLYVIKDTVGAAAGRGQAFFHDIRRAVICLFGVVVLLACAGGVAYADEGDPPDPDFGGFAYDDPALGAATPGQVDDPAAFDSDYGVMPFSFDVSDSATLSNCLNRLNEITTNVKLIQLDVDSIERRIKDYSTSLQSILNSLGASGDLYKRLSDIFLNTTAISNKLTTVNSNLDSVKTKLDTANQNLSSLITLVTGTNTRLDELIDIERGYQSYVYPIGDTPFTSFHSVFLNSFFYDGSTYLFGSRSSDSSWSVSTSSGFPFTIIGFDYGWRDPYPQIPFFQKDVYYLCSVSWVGSYSSFGDFSGFVSDSLSYRSVAGRVTLSFLLRYSSDFSWPYVSFPIHGVVSSGSFSFSVVRAPDSMVQDMQASGAVNPGQSSANEQLQQSAAQLEEFDQKTFEDVTKYTAQLDFGLGDWAEAASGISYIGSIFMLIWDNSPTQPIILSLMLGLCMLVLGRGARIASEFQSKDAHSERSQRRSKGS